MGRSASLSRHAPRFVQRLSERVVAELRPGRDHLLAEVCSPGGSLARELAGRVKPRDQVVAVCPGPPPSDGGPEIRWVDLDPAAFAAFPVRYDRVLVTDALVLVRQRRRFYADLRQRLADGGRLLIAQRRPHRELPLFKEALRRWESVWTPPDEAVRELEEAGFRVARSGFRYRHRMGPYRLAALIRSRAFPILCTFDDAELEARSADLAEGARRTRALSFEEHLDLFTAT